MSDDMVSIVCDEPTWHGCRPLTVAGFIRRDGGRWVLDNAAQMGIQGANAGGIPDWYTEPATGRVITTVDDAGVRLVCPRCKHRRPLTWAKLGPILDKAAAAGVPSLSLQQIAGILR